MQPGLDPSSKALFAVLEEALAGLGSRDRPVVEFADPGRILAALQEAIEGGIALDAAEAASPEALADAARVAVHFAVHTDHPRFMNQNFAGADPIAVIGDALGAALNTTSATYEAAPVFTLMERALLAFLARQIGWEERAIDAPVPAGLMFPGGSAANLAAMQVARVRADPELPRRGAAGGPRFVALTSTSAHYSIEKAVRCLGIGSEQLIEVPCDPTGAMRPDALEERLDALDREGARPFFLNLTAGTTVQGAFDPVAEILARVAGRNLWVHLDGAVGGGVLFSERERGRLQGVEGVDSMTWNLHKLSGVTQQCSALLLRRPEALAETFSTRANYLFQADKNHAQLDLGDLNFLCARRNDVLKAWLLIRGRGRAWLGKRIEHAVELAQKLEAWIEAHPEFVLAAPRSFSHVCFWWLPPELRQLDTEALLGDAEASAALHALAPRMKDAMQRRGDALVGVQPVQGGPNAWRMLFINPQVTWRDAESTMRSIAEIGAKLA